MERMVDKPGVQCRIQESIWAVLQHVVNVELMAFPTPVVVVKLLTLSIGECC